MFGIVTKEFPLDSNDNALDLSAIDGFDFTAQNKKIDELQISISSLRQEVTGQLNSIVNEINRLHFANKEPTGANVVPQHLSVTDVSDTKLPYASSACVATLRGDNPSVLSLACDGKRLFSGFDESGPLKFGM